ncbi:hypothetical protein [Neisseria meningitidis]|nr:hypothetical protein [Neisseria meningitidis]
MPSETQFLHFRRHFYSRLKSKIYTPVIPAQAGIRKVGPAVIFNHYRN